MQARPMPYMVKKNGVITHFSLHRPTDVLPGVHSEKDAKAALDFFSDPFVHGKLPEGKHAQRWHVLRVRPALRWFCKKYNIEVPKWLKGNGIYDNMTEEERQEHYGQPELLVNDFDDEDAPPEDHEDPDQQPPPHKEKKKPKKKEAKKKPKKKVKKSEHKDRLPGGLADDKMPEDFDAATLKEGIKVELEHTNDKKLAREIAMDHLTEDPKYYKKLKRMEKK